MSIISFDRLVFEILFVTKWWNRFSEQVMKKDEMHQFASLKFDIHFEVEIFQFQILIYKTI